MHTNKLLWLALGAAAVVCGVTCAPVHRVTPGDPDPTGETESRPREEILVAPTPMADGPRSRIEAAIENVRERELLTTNGFWTVLHGILGLGPTVMLRNPDTGERVNALDYICQGRDMRGLEFLPTRDGLDVRNWAGGQGVGQGHQDQFIAEMAEWGIEANRKFTVYGKDYAFMDFVRHSQMRACVTKSQELSWTLVVVGQYLGTDLSWTNLHGEHLTYEDLVRYELDASVEQAACGGTHRLFGLTWAYHLHLAKGGKKEGVWKDVRDKTIKYRDLAKRYQNSDGAFSTNFFKEPGNAPDKQLRISSTGHMLEWLATALPDDQLKEPWVQEAANALSLMILDLQGSPIEGGALYHAVHGLLVYHARLYGGFTGGSPGPLIHVPPRDALD